LGDALTDVVEHDQSMKLPKTVESMKFIGCIKVKFQFGEVGVATPRTELHDLPRSTAIAESMLQGDAKSLQLG
jgi:hypothetical protein